MPEKFSVRCGELIFENLKIGGVAFVGLVQKRDKKDKFDKTASHSFSLLFLLTKRHVSPDGFRMELNCI